MQCVHNLYKWCYCAPCTEWPTMFQLSNCSFTPTQTAYTLLCYFSTKSRDWLGITAPKRPILCWVGHKTETQSITISCTCQQQLPYILMKSITYTDHVPFSSKNEVSPWRDVTLLARRVLLVSYVVLWNDTDDNRRQWLLLVCPPPPLHYIGGPVMICTYCFLFAWIMTWIELLT